MKEKLAANYGIHTWVFGKHFCKKEKKMDVESLSLQEKQLTSLINFKFSKLKLKFWKILSATTSLASCQYSKTFLVRLVGY